MMPNPPSNHYLDYFFLATIWLLLAGCRTATPRETRSLPTDVPVLPTDVPVLLEATATLPLEPIENCSVDTHQHLDGLYLSQGQLTADYNAAAETAVASMNQSGIQKSLLMPPPISADPDQTFKYDYTALAQIAATNPNRFAFLGGGGTLNPIINQAVQIGEITPELRTQFEAKAAEIANSSAAGFGEMTALHLSFKANHPYIAAPPDHALFLLLADIAAQNDMPIDLHMEAVAQDSPLPTGFASPPNPAVLAENIEALERLLSHNREARIVWAHIGWDNTSYMTVELLRRLLQTHPNLYLSLKVVARTGLQTAENRPVDGATMRPEWIDLIGDFPDRFVLGADEFFGIPGLTPQRTPSTEATWELLDQLPAEIAYQLACKNPVIIYRLDK